MGLSLLEENIYMSSEDTRDDSIKISLLKFYYMQSVKSRLTSRPTRSFLFADIPELYRRSFRSNRNTRSNTCLNSFTLIQSLTDPFMRTSLDDLQMSLNSRNDTVWKSTNRYCKYYVDSAEEYELIRKNFLYLFATHRPSDGARLNSGNHEVHIHNIRQFFLDCSISSTDLLDIAMTNISFVR